MKKLGFSHESQDNLTVDWYTPPWVFEKLGVEFDLDPCQPDEKIPWIPTKSRYTLADDGLVSPWFGRVWLNPPYGKQTPLWLEKMHQHRNGIALVFARTDCKWFHDYIANADAVLFIKSRIKFVDGKKKTKGGGPGSGSMLVAWGPENVQALQKIADIGKLWDISRLDDLL